MLAEIGLQGADGIPTVVNRLQLTRPEGACLDRGTARRVSLLMDVAGKRNLISDITSSDATFRGDADRKIHRSFQLVIGNGRRGLSIPSILLIARILSGHLTSP